MPTELEEVSAAFSPLTQSLTNLHQARRVSPPWQYPRSPDRYVSTPSIHQQEPKLGGPMLKRTFSRGSSRSLLREGRLGLQGGEAGADQGFEVVDTGLRCMI